MCFLGLVLFVPLNNLASIVDQQSQTVSALEKARQASFDIAMKDYNIGGSAVLVSRIKLENGRYLYRALTAYHVVVKMAKALKTNSEKASRSMLMTFQPKFHGEQLQIQLDIKDIEWAAPTNDWAAFTFESEHKLECALVATKKEFEAIEPFEDIYGVAGAGPGGQQLRRGIIGMTHRVDVNYKTQKSHGWVWNHRPNDFFRAAFPIWYGDSGGAVLNKHGKLIGIMNALEIYNELPVSHLNIILKTYVIRDAVQHNPDFFKIEN